MISKPRVKLGEVALVECGTPSRNTCTSVSWNSTGAYLAWSSSDRLVRLWTLEQQSKNSSGGTSSSSTGNNNSSSSTSGAQEVLAISGHVGSVEMVRFHPHEPTLLCTSAVDATIRFWDVRWAKQQRGSVGRIDVKHGKVATSVEWSPMSDRPHSIVVTEADSHIYVYDTRKLTSNNNNAAETTPAARGATAAATTPIRSYNLQPNFVESCRFSPAGNHLVAAVTVRTYGLGEIHILPFSADETLTSELSMKSQFSYPAHTGSIFAHIFSPGGRRYATGGSDAIVGLWDVATMICSHTITRRAKFIRSLSFSHDSKLLASSSEDDGIDLADANNGDLIGNIPLGGRGGSGGLGARGGTGGGGGADEIVFHPKNLVLACARGNFSLGGSPVVVAKIALSEQVQ